MHKNEQPVSIREQSRSESLERLSDRQSLAYSLTEDQLDSIQNGHDFELFDRSHRTLQKSQ